MIVTKCPRCLSIGNRVNQKLEDWLETTDYKCSNPNCGFDWRETWIKESKIQNFMKGCPKCGNTDKKEMNRGDKFLSSSEEPEFEIQNWECKKCGHEWKWTQFITYKGRTRKDAEYDAFTDAL